MANQFTNRVRDAQLEACRQKIKITMLLNRLTDHAMGKLELSATQVQAIKILVGKVLPDLQATQISGDMEHNYVARMPGMPKSSDEWNKQHKPTMQ